MSLTTMQILLLYKHIADILIWLYVYDVICIFRCQNESSHLVSIHSDHEMEIVIRITMTHLESIWSGLSRSIEGSYI